MSRSVPAGRLSSMRRSCCSAERAQFAVLAATLGTPFSIFDCQADMTLLRQRLELRSQRQRAGVVDPSEADVVVLERLALADEPLTEPERADAIVVDAAQPATAAALATRWLAATVASLPGATPRVA